MAAGGEGVQKGLQVGTGVDQDGTAQAAWGAYALPVHIWLDEEGIVREIVYGGAPQEIFVDAISAVVPEFVAEGTPIPAPTDPAASAQPEE